jgi:hypothetical protein
MPTAIWRVTVSPRTTTARTLAQTGRVLIPALLTLDPSRSIPANVSSRASAVETSPVATNSASTHGARSKRLVPPTNSPAQ